MATSLFQLFVVVHIVTGATGLVAFWVPIATRKGGADHRRWGRVFCYAMLVTSVFASLIGLCTLAAPLETHPALTDVPLITGLFGTMMIYLAVLTSSLAWHGLVVVGNKSNPAANRHWVDVSLQVACILAALACGGHGYTIGQPLMMGLAVLGLISGPLNLSYDFTPKPSPRAYLLEHVKALTGAGTSVYTAFLSVGAVRIVPAHAFNPLIWAVPTVLGVGLMIYYLRQVSRPSGSRSTYNVR